MTIQMILEHLITWTQTLPSLKARKQEIPKISLPYYSDTHYGSLSSETTQIVASAIAQSADQHRCSPLVLASLIFCASGFYPHYHKIITVTEQEGQGDWLQYRWGLGGLRPEDFYAHIQGDTDDLLPLFLDPYRNVDESCQRLLRLVREEFVHEAQHAWYLPFYLALESCFTSIQEVKQTPLESQTFPHVIPYLQVMMEFHRHWTPEEQSLMEDVERFPHPAQWERLLPTAVAVQGDE